MPFLGTIVNFLVVLVLGIVGTFIKRGVPERISQAIMSAMAICVVYIGVSGMLEAAPSISDSELFSDGLIKVLVMIISLAIGTLIGELIDIDKWVNRLGEMLESKISRGGEHGNFSKGFISCSLMFCVGAMTINGAIQDAMGDPSILLAKSVIDGIAVLVMSSTLGIGCAFSAFFVLFYQGIMSVLGYFLVAILPASTITYMSVTGSLIVILIGTNILGFTKIKTANMVPAMFMPIAIAPLFSLIF